MCQKWDNDTNSTSRPATQMGHVFGTPCINGTFSHMCEAFQMFYSFMLLLWQVLQGNIGEEDWTSYRLINPIRTRFMRILPQAWEGNEICTRVEFYTENSQGLHKIYFILICALYERKEIFLTLYPARSFLWQHKEQTFVVKTSTICMI